MNDTINYCGSCEQICEPNDNGDCPECGTLIQPIKIDATPNDELRELVEQWREKPGLYNPEYVTDQMEYTVQKRCADELEELIGDE